MNPFVLSCLLIVLTTLPLGYFVYQQNRSRWVNRLWLIYSLSLTMWGFFGIIIGSTHNEGLALVCWRIAMGLGVIWMPVLFYHFAYLYAPWDEKNRLIFAYVVTGLLALSAFTNLYIPKLQFVFNSFYWATPGLTFYILNVWWFALTGYSHTKLLKSAKYMPKQRQIQIKYFIAAIDIGYIGGLANFSIVYGLKLYPWLNFLAVIYPLIMAYAIVKHGLFDIFIFIKEAFYTTVLVGFISLAMVYMGGVNNFLEVRFHFQRWGAPLIVACGTVFIMFLFLKNARKSDRLKQEFITVAAHKLRTPLTHIRYIADELRDVKDKKQKDDLVLKLQSSTEILIDLVNKLLDVANLEVQSEKYNFTSLNLAELTNDTLKHMSPLLEHKKLRVKFDVSNGLPHVQGYEKNVRFIIQTLIENAIMYSPENSEIKISISQNGPGLIWSIEDSGIGISKEDSEKIFEKFFRGQNALRADTEGTGLGLFMARNLVKRQGGDLKFISGGEGKGSRFWFNLPAD